MAQFGSALDWGSRGRRFKSAQPDEMGGEETVSARVLTVPNLISFARLGLIPLFVWTFATGRDLAALVVMFLIGSSDFIDGYVARRLRQVSVLGKLLDPLSDRVAILAAMVAFAVRGTVPASLAIAIVLRDAVVAVAFPILEARGYPRIPVNLAGKAGTMSIFWGMGFALLSVLVPGSLESMTRTVSTFLLIVGACLYWIAAGLYLVEIRKLFRQRAVS